MNGRWIWIAALAVMAAGCHRDMWLQAKEKGGRESAFFTDGNTSQPRVPGTVAVDEADQTSAFKTGYQNGRLVANIPVRVTPELVARGRDRFEIFCTHCHGAIGDGEGMIAQRGLKLAQPPANYHTDRLRQMPDGHFFDVITNGYGVMYPFSDRLPDEEDRWAIVAYIRALQLSQTFPAERLTPELRRNVLSPPAPEDDGHGGGHAGAPTDDTGRGPHGNTTNTGSEESH
jgi:mono/diheme cytochrome c family protein